MRTPQAEPSAHHLVVPAVAHILTSEWMKSLLLWFLQPSGVGDMCALTQTLAELLVERDEQLLCLLTSEAHVCSVTLQMLQNISEFCKLLFGGLR